MTRLVGMAALLTLPTIVFAQTDSAAASVMRYLHGTVMGRGHPVAGVNVFDLETLEGAITAVDGRFIIVIRDSTRIRVHIAARAMGFRPADTTMTIVAGDSVTLTLEPFTALSSISVQSGRYTASADRSATLTPIEVATTPGSNADISSAIKTLPGVQNVDEGTGLFVRGGDYTETRVFVDGAPLFTAYQFEAPTGSVAGTINPFLTDAITFSSGGFGAQWGNALSGIVDLRTLGRPQRSFTNINGSILGLSLGGGLALPHSVGISTTVGFANLSEMLDLNGNPRGYAPAPNSVTGSVLAAWDYDRSGTIKLFALRQQNGLGIPVNDPSGLASYTTHRSTDMAVASWTDSIGAWHPFVSASTSGLGRHDLLGVYDQSSTLRSTQLRADVQYRWSDRFTIDGGAEVERVAASFSGQLPANDYDLAPGAPTVPSLLDAAKARQAAWLSFDTRPTPTTELIVGGRTDRSGYATGGTADPRASFAWEPRDRLTFTASWGVYHQIADPAFLDRLSAGEALPALSAYMAIGGAQFGDGTHLLRLELWEKQYENLVGLTRSYETVPGLAGRARGADFFARGDLPDSVKWRTTWSMAVSRRQDPNTLLDAPAPFDVTNSVTLVLERDWAPGWHAGMAWKYATGHPFTDVSGATFDAVTQSYVPQFGSPLGQRLPDYSRTDFIISKQQPLGAGRFAIGFIGINNVFNEVNTFSYTWSRDYTQRIPVRSTVSRTFFIGANLVLLAKP